MKYSEKDIQYVKDNYKKKKAKDIAIDINKSVHTVYGIAKKYNLGQEQNKIIKIDDIAHQILISGAIGDGRFKRNGKYNYCYSECHSFGEIEYLKWKYDNLGELTLNSSLYGKNFNNEHNNAIEFTTLTTPSLIKYAERSLSENILLLNDLGLLLLIFDDGWSIKYKSGNALRLSFNNHFLDEMELLKEQYINVLNIDTRITGKK